MIDHPVTFEQPPVNEVVLSVQFTRALADDALALADFWPQIREEFPGLERHPPILAAVEDFSSPPQQQTVQFDFGPGAVPQRYWFVSPEGNDLIQFQPDRFLVNWRRLGTEQPYPRYDHVRTNFTNLYPRFVESVSGQVSDGIEAAWCEISYINEVEAQPESGHGHMELSRVLRLFGERINHEVLPDPEDSQFQERFLLRRGEEPFGRFYLNATPAYRSSDGAAIYIVTLLVRGMPVDGSTEAIVDFFDDGHDRIVRTFREITTDEMHARWGLVP